MYHSIDDHQDFVITEIYTTADGESDFREIFIDTEILKNLGYYSEKTDVKGLFFRKSLVNKPYDFHTAPTKQFIVYLSGEAEIEASNGKIKKFKSGDILLANDLTGKGHRSTITKNGKALIIEAGKNG